MSEPICTTKSGEVVDRIAVARGTRFMLPIAYTNNLEAMRGTDAKVFQPERWLETDGIPDTKVGLRRDILLRPKVIGEKGIKIPLRVRRYEG